MVDAGMATEVAFGVTVEVAVVALLALSYQPSIYERDGVERRA
jgi:tetrahydromethanopterin S-methyltransferase subunit B